MTASARKQTYRNQMKIIKTHNKAPQPIANAPAEFQR